MPTGLLDQVLEIYNDFEECVPYAKCGEIVKIRLNTENEETINKGEIICPR
jgi:translation elongation factor EF-1alpha